MISDLNEEITKAKNLEAKLQQKNKDVEAQNIILRSKIERLNERTMPNQID